MRVGEMSRRVALTVGASVLAQVLLASSARAVEAQQPPPPPRAPAQAPAQIPAPAAEPPAQGAPPATGTPDAARLPLGAWNWLRSEYNNDTKVEAAHPDRYTVELKPNGNLAVRADCNRGFGTYTLDGAAITIRPVAITRAFCGPDSQDTVFLKDLGEVVTYVFDGDLLVLNLRIDAGNMIFEPVTASS
ncbi:MAG: META domain-containing protein [Chloroflexota bacterium]